MPEIFFSINSSDPNVDIGGQNVIKISLLLKNKGELFCSLTKNNLSILNLLNLDLDWDMLQD